MHLCRTCMHIHENACTCTEHTCTYAKHVHTQYTDPCAPMQLHMHVHENRKKHTCTHANEFNAHARRHLHMLSHFARARRISKRPDDQASLVLASGTTSKKLSRSQMFSNLPVKAARCLVSVEMSYCIKESDQKKGPYGLFRGV